MRLLCVPDDCGNSGMGLGNSPTENGPNLPLVLHAPFLRPRTATSFLVSESLPSGIHNGRRRNGSTARIFTPTVVGPIHAPYGPPGNELRTDSVPPRRAHRRPTGAPDQAAAVPAPVAIMIGAATGAGIMMMETTDNRQRITATRPLLFGDAYSRGPCLRHGPFVWIDGLFHLPPLP